MVFFRESASSRQVMLTCSSEGDDRTSWNAHAHTCTHGHTHTHTHTRTCIHMHAPTCTHTHTHTHMHIYCKLTNIYRLIFLKLRDVKKKWSRKVAIPQQDSNLGSLHSKHVFYQLSYGTRTNTSKSLWLQNNDYCTCRICTLQYQRNIGRNPYQQRWNTGRWCGYEIGDLFLGDVRL